MKIISTIKISLITALVTLLSFFLVSCGEGIGGTGSPFSTVADGGIGGTGSQAAPLARETFNLEGTVPGTLIEAFCSDGSYISTQSEENGSNEHPYLLKIPKGVFCRVVMTTNESDINNKVITPIRLVNSQDEGGIAFTADENIDAGFADLALTRLDMKLDANQDGVEDAPLDIKVEANIEILTAGEDPLDKNNNGIIDLYEDDDGDGINNKDDDDDDGDGILDINDPDRVNDLDGDGIPNDEDLDATNDGVLDKEVTDGTDGNTGGDNGGNTIVLIAKDDQSSTEKNKSVIIDVVDNDTDPEGSGLKITALSKPENGVAIEEAGQIKYTPNANFSGKDTFTYTVIDASNKEVTATVIVTVNDVNVPPVLQDDTASTDEGKAVTIDVLANDTDADEDLLSIVSFSNPANGNVNQLDGKLVYTPKSGFSGEDAFTYIVTDANTEDVTATVIVTVKKVNKVPVAKDDVASTDENKFVNIDVLSNDTDPDGDKLTITQVGKPANGTATKQGGKIRYTPNEAFSGEDSFSYSVDDGNKHLVSARVTVTVNKVNKPPVANADQATTDEGNAVVIDVLGNDTDPDSDVLKILQFSNPVSGSVVKSNGKLQYTPNKAFFGEDTFTYTITDGNDHKATATVSVIVNKVNKPPVAVNDNLVINENNAVDIDVLANDSDADGDVLTIKIISAPANGNVAVLQGTGNTGAKIQYTPKTGFSGIDIFTYEISDGNDLVATATVTVDVLKVNKLPVAIDDSAVTDENQAVIIDVLNNDTDPDGDALTIVLLGNPENGTVNAIEGRIEYIPTTDFSGEDSFTYVISDGNNHEVTATVRVTVNKVNRSPVAKNDDAKTNDNQAVTIDVLANDTDLDGDTLSIVDFSSSANGRVDLIDGQLQYTPTVGSPATDTFTYTINDGNGQEASATVTINVIENQIPEAKDDRYFVNLNRSDPLPVLENDSDPDGDRFIITSVTQPDPLTKGLVLLTTNLLVPKLTYFPAKVGTHSFTYTISDGRGLSSTATVTVTVEEVAQ